MIVKMKKAVVFMKTSQKEEALKRLRDVGVVHLSAVTPAENSNLEDLKRKAEQTSIVQSILSDVKTKQKSSSVTFNGEQVVNEVMELKTERERLNDDSLRCANQISLLEPWGDFNPQDLKTLSEGGFALRMMIFTQKQLKELSENISYVVLQRSKKGVMVVLINCDEELEGVELPIPEHSLGELRRRIEENQKLAALATEKIKSYAGAVGTLRAYSDELSARLEFETYRNGAQGDEAVSFLTGFVPVDSLEELKKACREASIGLALDDPLEEEPVPTKIKNGKIVSLIQPVFNFLGTIPGYRELDINGFFLFFFSIFFAMIIGDAGYGLIFLLGSIAAMVSSKKKSGSVSPFAVLVAWLSFCTILWGALSGNWFASQTIAQWPPLKALVVPALDAFDDMSSDTVKALSFIIGTIQISIAHIWSFFRGLKQQPRLKAFTELGWLMICWGMFNLILMLILKMPMLPISYGFVGVGVLFLVIFGKQDDNHFFKNILKGVTGIVSTFLDTVSMFSDIMSYIRLFAVGLASFQIELAFSSMATSLSESMGIGGMIFAALILVFGHGLNMMLGVLAILVHAVRLNLLEFAGHLGQQWVGIQYQPFKNTKSNQE